MITIIVGGTELHFFLSENFSISNLSCSFGKEGNGNVVRSATMSPTHYAVPRGGNAGTSLRLPDFNQEKTDMGEDSLRTEEQTSYDVNKSLHLEANSKWFQ